ncbi:MAG: O-antigen ligase family protein [Coriobacteriia bacterium]|nr:O-antigen ligase family protein [Coriobacteriia bacterium]
MSASKAPKKAAQASPASAPLTAGGVVLELGVLLGGLGVCLAMQPTSFNPFGPIKALVVALGVTLALVGMALESGRTARAAARLGRVRASFAVPALLLVGALATVTSVDPQRSILGHYAEYQGLLLVVAAALIGCGAAVLADDRAAWTRLKRAATLAVGVVSGFALVQVFGAGPGRVDLSRAASTTGNASNLGVFLCLAVPLVLAAARSERGRAWPAVAWTAFAMGLVVLGLTLSRGAWLGAGGALVAWLVLEGRTWPGRLRGRVWAAAGVLVVVALAATLLFVPHAGSRLVEAVRSPSKGTLGWRAETWRLTAGLVAQRPLLGFGPASFRYAFPAVRTPATIIGESATQIVDDPHNLLLSIGVQYGVVAVGLLLWLLCGAIAALWHLAGGEGDDTVTAAALAASIVGASVALQAHFLTLDTWPLFGLVIGWALGLCSARLALEPAPLPAGTQSMARWTSGVLAVAFGVVTVAAAGLVWADTVSLHAERLSAARAPWTTVRGEFERSIALAPWEPAMRWTFARAASQRVDLASEPAAFRDAEAQFASVRQAIPSDQLVIEQQAQLYIVASFRLQAPALARQGLELAQQAAQLDPQNGFKWETVGGAYLAGGDVPAARTAYEKAVALNPRDVQAWTNLALVYDRLGDKAAAANARKQGKKAATAPVIRFQ